MKKLNKGNYTIPIVIVLSGIFIAGALFFAVNSSSNTKTQETENVDKTSQLREVGENDHILGSKNPKVTIVEYSDLECPFCSKLHKTLNTIVEENNDVAWVFRQFPLESLHPKNAMNASIASECVAEIGGNDAFWKFVNGYFAISLGSDRTNFSVIVPDLVKRIGLDKNKFDECVASGKYDKHIRDDIKNATVTGGRGTPWSIIITAGGDTIPLNGAQPVEKIRELIEFARNN